MSEYASVDAERAKAAPAPARPAAAPSSRTAQLIALQRTGGNAAVRSMLAVQRACCSGCAGGGSCEDARV